MKIGTFARRFLLPRFAISIYFAARFRCFVSHRAEVEPARRLSIGKGTEIGSFTKVKATDGDLSIGARVSIGPNCFITSSKGGLAIGDYTMIGANTCIIGNNYRYDRLDVPICEQEHDSVGIRIGENVWLGCGTIVMDGAEIGDGSIISTNSVVSGKIPPNSIAQGNPATVIFERR
jgi:acetyltransferase-like isoleucine patch superfamily enzyme